MLVFNYKMKMYACGHVVMSGRLHAMLVVLLVHHVLMFLVHAELLLRHEGLLVHTKVLLRHGRGHHEARLRVHRRTLHLLLVEVVLKNKLQNKKLLFIIIILKYYFDIILKFFFLERGERNDALWAFVIYTTIIF